MGGRWVDTTQVGVVPSGSASPLRSRGHRRPLGRTLPGPSRSSPTGTLTTETRRAGCPPTREGSTRARGPRVALAVSADHRCQVDHPKAVAATLWNW